MLIQVYQSSCIEKVALTRILCGMLYGSYSGSYVTHGVQEKVGKVKR